MHYNDSVIFDIITQSFFKFCQSFFLKFVTCYNNSVIFPIPPQPFFYSDSVIFLLLSDIFLFRPHATVHRHFLPYWFSYFLDFVSHILDFIVCYSDSAIFVIVIQSFFRFHWSFLRFRCALQWLNHFLFLLFILFLLQWLPFFRFF
jgi:hypothetical protein